MRSLQVVALVSLAAAVRAQTVDTCPSVNQGSYDFSSYPKSWQVAPGSQANSQEFLNAYNSFDWDNAPDIPVRPIVNGGVSTSGYSAKDPDCWWTASLCTESKLEGIPSDISECPEPNTFGLTYDDGPDCNNAKLYDDLADHNQLASLFYIGSNVMTYPTQAKAGYAAGHHIGVHTWAHSAMTSLTNEQIFGEFYYTIKVIKQVLGITPLYWRPPYGDVDDRVRYIAYHGFNLTAIIWNRDSNDWKITDEESEEDVDETILGVIEEEENGTFATSGVIMLEHELNPYTIDTAIKWLPSIIGNFTYVMPAASCMNITRPYAEEVSFLNFNQYASKYYNRSTGSPLSPSSETGTGNVGHKQSRGVIHQYLSSLYLVLITAAGVFFLM